MTRSRFKKRPYVFGDKKEEPSLAKIILAIVAIGAMAYGGIQGYRRFSGGYVGEKGIATAAEDLEQARILAEQGKDGEARTILDTLIEKINHNEITPRSLLLLADLEQRSENNTRALQLLARARNEFPGSPSHANISLTYGRLLEAAGRGDEAATVYEELRAETPGHVHAPALTGLGRLAEQNDDTIAARTFYHQAVAAAEWDSPSWNEALDALGHVNTGLLFASTPLPESKLYIVEKGDTLTAIGVRLNTTQGMLTRANGIDNPASLSVGQRLKYTPKDFRIVIERSTCRLFLFDGNGIFKRYYTGLGREGHETTLGAYRIGNKEKNPTWHRKGAEPIPFGDPRNELGTRWMPLVPIEENLPTDLGIHGTTKPETVGSFASSGCARLIKEDIEELYDLVVRSTPVHIVERLDPGKLPGVA